MQWANGTLLHQRAHHNKPSHDMFPKSSPQFSHSIETALRLHTKIHRAFLMVIECICAPHNDLEEHTTHCTISFDPITRQR